MVSLGWYKRVAIIIKFLKADSRSRTNMKNARSCPVTASVSYISSQPQNPYDVERRNSPSSTKGNVKRGSKLRAASKEWQITRQKRPKVTLAAKFKLRSVFARIRQFFRRIFRRRRSVSDSIVFKTFGKHPRQWDGLALMVFSHLTREYIHGTKDARALKTDSAVPMLYNMPKIKNQIVSTIACPETLLAPLIETEANLALYVSIRIENLYPFPKKSTYIVEHIYPFTSETKFGKVERQNDFLIYALALAYLNPIIGSMIFLATLCVPFVLKDQKSQFIPRPFICGTRKTAFHPVVKNVNQIQKLKMFQKSSKDICWRINQLTPTSPGDSADIFSLKDSAEATPTASVPSPDDRTEERRKENVNHPNSSLEKIAFACGNIDFTSCGIQTQKLIREEAFTISSTLLQSCYALEFLKGILQDTIFSDDLNIDDVVVTNTTMDWTKAKLQITRDSALRDYEFNTDFEWYEHLRFEEENIGIAQHEKQEGVAISQELNSLEFVDWVSQRFPQLFNQIPIILPSEYEEQASSRFINVRFNNNYDVINLQFQQDDAIYRQVLLFEKDTPPAEFNLHSYDKKKKPQKSILKRSATTQDFAEQVKVERTSEDDFETVTYDFSSLKNILENVTKRDIHSVVKGFRDAFEGLLSTANVSRVSFSRLAIAAQKQYSEIYHVTLGIANEVEVVIQTKEYSTSRLSKILDNLSDCTSRLFVARQKSADVEDCIPTILTSFILQRREILSKRKIILPIYYKFVNECSKTYHIRPDSFHKVSGKKSFDDGCKFLVGVSICSLEESLKSDVNKLETAGQLVEYMTKSLQERLFQFEAVSNKKQV